MQQSREVVGLGPARDHSSHQPTHHAPLSRGAVGSVPYGYAHAGQRGSVKRCDRAAPFRPTRPRSRAGGPPAERRGRPRAGAGRPLAAVGARGRASRKSSRGRLARPTRTATPPRRGPPSTAGDVSRLRRGWAPAPHAGCAGRPRRPSGPGGRPLATGEGRPRRSRSGSDRGPSAPRLGLPSNLGPSVPAVLAQGRLDRSRLDLAASAGAGSPHSPGCEAREHTMLVVPVFVRTDTGRRGLTPRPAALGPRDG